ncbi:TonB-dependent receptor [Sphingomonas sp. LHG3406-1]|uniref:TonB-dependent receptor domain-containing protein n=1 Tax=Sphingomonas sp. LHG3406-1 TaxID=2804617 RepID=UPI00261029DF|nr:TonB-dependent receptor [Sphingomonas sp. LHG3406-1]
MTRTTRLPTAALRSLLLAGAAFGFSSAAFAQEAPAPAPAEEAQPEEAPEITSANPVPQVQSDQEVVVTGSRIRTSPFSSPDPVAIINPELSERKGNVDLAQTLQSSPIAAGSTQITSALSSNFVTNGGPGASTLDLRGLGANRTLILLNGRRAGPAGTRGGVSSFDLNVLPQSVVQSVEILKTGASSVYGSDAVAGVVNLITKRDTGGLQLDLNTVIPQEGGGEQYRASAIYGKDFGRFYFTVAGDYFKQKELSRGDRKFLGCPEAYTFRPDGSRADLIDPRTNSYKCEDLRWGHVWTYNLIDNLYLDGPGGPNTGPNTSINGGTVLIQYQYPGENLGIPAYGAPDYFGDLGTPPGWFPTGYDQRSLAVQNSYHPFVLEQTIIPKTERATGYLSAGLEITDNIEAFTEFLVNRRKTYQNGWRQFWNFGYTGDLYGTGNLYGTGTIWAQGWEGINYLSPTGITNLSDSSQTVDYYRGVGGLRGDIGFLPGWKFDSYVQYSRSKGVYRTQQILQDVYDSGYFQTSSCVGQVLPVSGKQCIDLPWTDPFFLAGQLTPQQANFLTSWEAGKTIYTQLNGEFSVSGNLIRLPYGTVGMALGASVRRDRINDTPGEITRAGNAWGASTSGITAGESITREAFGEINVPILRGLPFANDLTINAAARVTSVTAERKSDGAKDEDNGNWTYKLGGNYAPTSWLRFRGTYGTSYRAPALFEQFLANETSFTAVRNIDPCTNYAAAFALGTINQRIRDNCASQGIPGNFTGGAITATVRSQGGLGLLEAETSTAKTASIVLTPRFGGALSNTRFDFAVDWFDIKVKGQIAQLGAANIVFGCYNSTSFPTDPLCALFTRAGPGTQQFIIQTVDNKYINIAQQRVAGYDFTASVRHNAGRLGQFSLLGNATYQTKQIFDLFVGTGRNSAGFVGAPKFVGDLNLTWTSANDTGWSVYYGLDIIGKSSSKELVDEIDSTTQPGCFVPSQPTPVLRGTYCPKVTTPTVLYHAASITKEIEGFDFTLGVSNLFDKKPPRVSVLNGGTISTLGQAAAVSQYDWLGRRFFVNVTAKLGRKR